MPNIYLSSTYADLKEHRQAVYKALCKSGYSVVAMEDYVATDQRPVEECLQDVSTCDVYVGLFAFRYGYIPPVEQGNPDQLSITELEFRRAEALGKTCLVFLVKDDAPWPPTSTDAFTGDGERGDRIKRLRRYLATEKTASFFQSPYDLASEAQTAITRAIQDDVPEAPQPAPDIASTSWDIEVNGSPYPGLLHFTRRFAPVFFGRDAEVRDLLDRLSGDELRFLLISGDSGSGKSSLVDGGVLPALRSLGLPPGQGIRDVRALPSRGDHPFDALLRALQPLAYDAGLESEGMADKFLAEPRRMHDWLADLAARIEGHHLVIFMDQMEELFTVQDQEYTGHFLTALADAARSQLCYVIATIRADMLHHCHAHDDMLTVLRGPGHYPLGRVEAFMMHDMIARPARAAGLELPESLARRLIRDTGAEPGALPLLSFVLQQLFDRRENNRITEKTYDDLGGLEGAISRHIQNIEQQMVSSMDDDLPERLPALFQALLIVDFDGTPTRRWIRRSDLSGSARQLIEPLVRGRLLCTEGEGDNARVSIAHEKLFEAWPRLRSWIEDNREYLRQLEHAKFEAEQWERNHHNVDHLRHPPKRQQALQTLAQRFPDTGKNTPLSRCLLPQETLIERLSDASVDHPERLENGLYLAVLGDNRFGVGLNADGVPEIDWAPVPGGRVELEDDAGSFEVERFEMARHLVTNAQFQAFIDARDGYFRKEWWQGIERSDGPDAPGWSEANHPRDTVAWYEAVAFCHWLSRRLDRDVSLPNEWQWQQAATGGDPGNIYPWGREWDPARCNTRESGLGRISAVGMYPNGASAQGILDLAGNVWEWCLDKDSGSTAIDDSGDTRVLRGGSWDHSPDYARSGFRIRSRPVTRNFYLGFRVVCAPHVKP